uniref:Glutamate--cysteine ligase n=1 Tax=Candidatus Kentrum sp. MB TaxID=2138164 RepID=A0A451BE78_9GAMM|nr:MAG: glutamate--cysteine ligase [Candidatus Kentron sp. MB]VFK34138.1 MAG: glutamate--cysteine ligase [Candidatus Kentron sp. MB]VFK76585.1 MAG: glutamate--cysteine ligase [Candidatus Kentron sp. MB]
MKIHDDQGPGNVEQSQLPARGGIGDLLWARRPDVEDWISSQWGTLEAISARKFCTPFYASVDLRNSGLKLAPVDTNLFPSGFNNLSPSCLPGCAMAARTAIARVMPTARRLLLIPENHTRNFHYLESVASLADILTAAGLTVRIGSLLPDLEGPMTMDLPSGKQLCLEPVLRQGRDIAVAGFVPCVVLLNNDLAAGHPKVLEDCRQAVIPSPDLSWEHRLKSEHFARYEQVATEFADCLGVDPWLINPLFQNCGEIDFMRREGEECLAHNVEALLAQIRERYRRYGVDEEPFVFMKADAGTYGMGVMPVYAAEDIHVLNRRQRSRMSSAKGGRAVTKVILQEGIRTRETRGDRPAVAEPVVYLMDRAVVGGFYRVHAKRGVTENLNAPGMRFEPTPFFALTCASLDSNGKIDAKWARFYGYGVVARLALLAAAHEMMTVETEEGKRRAD